MIKKLVPSWILDRYSSCMDKYWSIKKQKKLIREVDNYNSHLQEKIDDVSSKESIKVVFYVLNLGMWKSDKLFKLLLDNKHFSPVVVSYLFEKDSIEYNRNISIKLRNYFESKGFPYQDGFDFDTGKMIHIDSMNPDIVFYPQPYLDDMSALPYKALMAYVPYSFMMSEVAGLHNFLFQNICWKMFYPTEIHKQLEVKYTYNKGANVVVTGNPLADYFTELHDLDDSMWKQKDPSIKRIIWAPHHSIFPNDALDIATFMDIADGMLELTKKYEGKVQFVFKPHPRLEPKLHLALKWGNEKTTAYYNEWRNSPNCNLVDGNYVDLFLTSDALIHDCGTFSAEYLYVNKPVMFLSDKIYIERFNEFANACYKVHYHGSTLEEIESFIQMVLDGDDKMVNERTQFINTNLLPPEGTTVSGSIYKEICDGLNVPMK